MKTRPTTCRRINIRLASVIEFGVAYQDVAGYPSAMHYLREQGVRSDIVQRVLAAPHQRRAAEPAPGAHSTHDSGHLSASVSIEPE
jgi:hypothetical protein